MSQLNVQSTNTQMRPDYVTTQYIRMQYVGTTNTCGILVSCQASDFGEDSFTKKAT